MYYDDRRERLAICLVWTAPPSGYVSVVAERKAETED
jgi:hypothetical protein